MTVSRLSTALLALTAALGLAGPILAAPLSPTENYLVTVSASQVSPVKAFIEVSGGTVSSANADSGLLSVSMPERSAELLRAAGIAIAEERTTGFTLSTIPNSSTLDRLDQASLPLDGVFAAPATENGTGVDIYVLDSGVVSTHEVFGSRVQVGRAFINTPASAGTAGTGPGNQDTCSGHGTHVAGIAAGKGIGVAPGATIIPVRVFGCDPANPSQKLDVSAAQQAIDLTYAFQWIVEHHQAGKPAVVNMSIGGTAGGTQTMDTWIEKGQLEGIAYVGAAGNSNAYSCNYWPAAVPKVISVGAFYTSSNGSEDRSAFSNYGDCVDVHAPGGQADLATQTQTDGVLSSWPMDASGAASNVSYARAAGTSQASPAVAGAVARYFSANPTHTPTQAIETVLSLSTSNKLSSTTLMGTANKILYIPKTGYKVASVPTPSPTPTTPVTTPSPTPTTPVTPSPTPTTPSASAPGSPAQVTLTASGANLLMTWSAPSKGGPVSEYRVNIVSTDGKISKSLTVAANSRSVTFAGVTAGTTFSGSVIAANQYGTSAAAMSNAITLSTARAAAPVIRSVSVAVGKATFRWFAPKGIPANSVIRYEIRWTTASGVDKWTTWRSTSDLSYTVQPLTRKQTRYVQIRAITAAGEGQPVMMSVRSR